MEAEADVHKMLEMVMAAVNDAIEDGYEFPIRIIVLAANGSVIAVEYRGEGQAERLCDFSRDGVFVSPLNLYISDSANRNRTIIVKPRKTPAWAN